MRRFRFTVAAVLALAFPSSLVAQGGVSGALSGTVRSQGRPVAGATVRLTSPALQGERVVMTGPNGDYVARGLPPGEYVVEFSTAGMGTARRSTTIDLSGTTRLDAELEIVARAAVRVHGEAPSPIATAVLGANFKARELNRLPVGRTLPAIATLAPGVTARVPRAGQVSIHGSLPYDNAFLVDGSDINDNLVGVPDNLYIEEGIAETAVLTGGIPAEYGRFTGGVISAVTKSGGNTFSGSFRLDLANPDWTKKTPFEEERGIPRIDDFDELYSATLGGAILRDRLWFFAAGRLSETTQAQTLPESGARVNTVTDNPRWEVKLTGNLASSHTVQASYLENDAETLDRPALPVVADPRAVDASRTNPNSRWMGSYRGVVMPNLFLELKYSEKEFALFGSGGDATAIEDSPFQTLSPPPRLYNTPYFDASDPDRRDNQDFAGSVSYFLATSRLGSHDVKLGYERFRTTRVGGNSQSSTGYVFTTNYETRTGAPVGPPALDAEGRFIPIFVNSGPLRTILTNWVPVRGSRIDITTDALYLQDAWRPNDHLSFNLGVRYEATRSEATGGVVATDTDRFTPRLAASYDVWGDARLTFDATYGQYAGRFTETQFNRNSNVGSPSALTYAYNGPNGRGVDFAPGFDLANYTLINANVPTVNVFFADDVRSPVVDEWTLGAGTAFRRGFARVAYVHRAYSDLLEDFIRTELGTTELVVAGRSFGFFDNVLLDNTDDPVREFQAIELQGRYRLADRWILDAHYTYVIEDHGNFVSGAGESSIFGDRPELYDPARHYPLGRFGNYQEHRVRVFSSYSVPITSFADLDVGLAYSYDSPLLFSYTFTRAGLTPQQVARDPGYARRPASQTVFFGERGVGEYEDFHSLDLALSLNLRVWKSLEPFARFEVRNLTNEQRLVAFDTVVIPCTSSTQAGCNGAAPVDELGLPTSFVRGPSFGTARSAADYQTPREYRASVGVRF